MTAYSLLRYFASEEPKRYLTDRDCVVEENTLSPNQKFRLLIYRFDAGAFGDGRIFWAVTPADGINHNLANYELPDGYQANGWTADNELIVEKWEPYYYREKLGELKTGDTFNGVKVKLVESRTRPMRKD
ncbi:MAG: hypothetical protein ACREA2_01675 [Blastocatellia bacterium]